MTEIPKIVHTFEAMTIPFTATIVTRDPEEGQKLLNKVIPAIQKELDRIEADYSPFREDSLVSRFVAGQDEILLNNQEFYAIYAACARAEMETQGYFTAYYMGTYDPTGYVKGWAVEKIFNQFLKPLFAYDSIVAICFNGGGDMQFASQTDSDFQWKLAVEDPEKPQEIKAIYQLANGAMATSGFSKRGQHSRQVQGSQTQQVTIIANSLAQADIWATVGLISSTSDFETMIIKGKLSGLLCQPDGMTIFNKGELSYA